MLKSKVFGVQLAASMLCQPRNLSKKTLSTNWAWKTDLHTVKLDEMLISTAALMNIYGTWRKVALINLYFLYNYVAYARMAW